MSYVDQEIHQLINQGKKMEAVKKVMALKGFGLKEAKDYVDSLIQPARLNTTDISEETLEFEIRDLLARGRKIEAIKKVRSLTGWGLKKAKDFVDSVDPHFRRRMGW